jgi:hypothetical protein
LILCSAVQRWHEIYAKFKAVFFTSPCRLACA